MSNALIFEIKRFAIHDGDGIRTTVFFKGCPLKCVWCHNPEGLSFKAEVGYYSHKCKNCGECIEECISGANNFNLNKHEFDYSKCMACGKCESLCQGGALKLYGKNFSVSEIYNTVMEDSLFYKEMGGGVTLSGGECLMQSEFCRELLKMLKLADVNTAVDTSGYVPKKAIDDVIPYTDVFLYDIKAIDEDVHIKCTGKSNKIILENLLYIDKLGKKTEVRIPYVPGYNDSQIVKIGEFLSKLKNLEKVRVLAYHNYAASKYDALNIKNTLPETLPSEEALVNAKQTLRDFGIKVCD